jgi:hypothetical protein
LSGELHVLLCEQGADALRQDELTALLRQELLQLEVTDVRPLQGGSAPAGARGLDAAAVGGLAVALGQSAQGLRAVVATVVGWLSRGRDDAPRSIRMEIDGDSVEISGVSRVDEGRLLDVFIQRHLPKADERWTADEEP